MFTRKMIVVTIMMFLAIMSINAWGLIYWESDWDKNGGPPTTLDTPDEKVMVGLEYPSAMPTATIIAPNFIITANHWGGIIL